MLKLTEAELAELGFKRRGLYVRGMFYYGFPFVMTYSLPTGRFYATDSSGELAECYPQTKEDLLTLIRLFTPPQEVKDVG